MTPLVQRTEHVLRPDPGLVVTTMFLPGQELLIAGRSRATAVLALSDDQVDSSLERTMQALRARHRDLTGPSAPGSP